ncbi:unnamed protein product, partial [Prorocentrum cordatum]
ALQRRAMIELAQGSAAAAAAAVPERLPQTMALDMQAQHGQPQQFPQQPSRSTSDGFPAVGEAPEDELATEAGVVAIGTAHAARRRDRCRGRVPVGAPRRPCHLEGRGGHGGDPRRRGPRGQEGQGCSSSGRSDGRSRGPVATLT